MIGVTENSGRGFAGVPPTPAALPRKGLVIHEDEEDEKDGTPALVEASGDRTTPAVVATTGQIMDQATTAAVEKTRLAFFAAWDEGAANRIRQGQLLLEAQEKLAKYGTGTFNAMLIAARPDGFGFKSPTSAYDLMSEAKGKPKRSHKPKKATGPTPGRSNGQPESLPMNLDGAPSPFIPVEIPADLATALDTSHTHTYVPFRFKGVYVPKADVEGFAAWIEAFSPTQLSAQFLAWYQAANSRSRREESNETTTSIQ
jgi:hypothetical protein